MINKPEEISSTTAVQDASCSSRFTYMENNSNSNSDCGAHISGHVPPVARKAFLAWTFSTRDIPPTASGLYWPRKTICQPKEGKRREDLTIFGFDDAYLVPRLLQLVYRQRNMHNAELVFAIKYQG